jgi:hypothetical protein
MMRDAFKLLTGGLGAVRQEHLLVAASLFLTVFAGANVFFIVLR